MQRNAFSCNLWNSSTVSWCFARACWSSSLVKCPHAALLYRTQNRNRTIGSHTVDQILNGSAVITCLLSDHSTAVQNLVDSV